MLIEDKMCEDMDWTNLAQDKDNWIFLLIYLKAF
jgi:hypothetical protein